MKKFFLAGILIIILALAAIASIKIIRKIGRGSAFPVPSSSVKPSDKDKKEVKGELSKVKVASLYESVTDGAQIDRGTNDVVDIFKETQTDLIFRGFWRWVPIPESPDNISSEILQYLADAAKINPNQVPEIMRTSGRSYQQLARSISEIKKEAPNSIFVGAIPAQKVNRVETNDMTGEIYKDTWSMALDPQKWNLTKTKQETQQQLQKMLGFKNDAYFPDITNPEFQKLLLSWAEKQIESGADAIWIDMLYSQPRILNEISGNANHPAVKESYESASKIVDKIHEFGQDKYGKYIYIGTWSTVAELPYSFPAIDFVTATVSSQELMDKKVNDARWESIISGVKKKANNIPIYAFIDWGSSNSPTAVFSQKLSVEDQRQALRNIDASLTNKGIVFVYPIHGGFMGSDAKRLSFGKINNYDSFAPEFDTYDTIKELANKK